MHHWGQDKKHDWRLGEDDWPCSCTWSLLVQSPSGKRKSHWEIGWKKWIVIGDLKIKRPTSGEWFLESVTKKGERVNLPEMLKIEEVLQLGTLQQGGNHWWVYNKSRKI